VAHALERVDAVGIERFASTLSPRGSELGLDVRPQERVDACALVDAGVDVSDPLGTLGVAGEPAPGMRAPQLGVWIGAGGSLHRFGRVAQAGPPVASGRLEQSLLGARRVGRGIGHLGCLCR
jgi:hypothetical protein